MTDFSVVTGGAGFVGKHLVRKLRARGERVRSFDLAAPAHEDDVQGSIDVGKRADLVVLNRNLFDIDPYEISDAYVTMTLFDGQIVYQRTE